MDIYDFFNSRDIAEHCRKIGKTWNTFEMAAIIHRSNRTVFQKHDAWRELIENYPDAPAPTKVIPWWDKKEFIMFGSVHTKLTEIIKYEQRLFDRLKVPESGAVYRHKVWWSGEHRLSDTVFSTFEKVVADSPHERWERDEAPKIIIEKIFIDDTISIEALFDYDMNLLDIVFCGNENRRKEWFPDIDFGDDSDSYVADAFDWFYLDIPTPFKRGDILTYSGNVHRRDDDYIFVLDYIDRDNNEWLKKHLEWGDTSDMRCGGYSISDEGVLVHTALDFYDELEYFRGELKGGDKLLHYVSLFLNDKIDLPTILMVQCKIATENLLSRFHLENTPAE